MFVKTNEKITALELRVIDEAGANVGVLPLAEALKIAKERGLDLIEIAPTAKPPVAKIMSYDKYRYQETKKLKKQRSQQKVQELKMVRLSARAAEHDLQVKAKKVNEFLYDVDVEEFISHAEKTKTILEINASDRADLNDEYIKKCVDQEVKLAIDSDAHSTSHFEWLEYGIAQARRGWCEKKDIINTQNWKDMLDLLK